MNLLGNEFIRLENVFSIGLVFFVLLDDFLIILVFYPLWKDKECDRFLNKTMAVNFCARLSCPKKCGFAFLISEFSQAVQWMDEKQKLGKDQALD